MFNPCEQGWQMRDSGFVVTFGEKEELWLMAKEAESSHYHLPCAVSLLLPGDVGDEATCAWIEN